MTPSELAAVIARLKMHFEVGAICFDERHFNCQAKADVEAFQQNLPTILQALEEQGKLEIALRETVNAKIRMNSMVGAPYFAQECLEFAASKAIEALAEIDKAK
jgi:hypothetical protein